MIHHATPALPIVEWCVLFIPIMFHALLGIYFARSGKPNIKEYQYQDNFRYSLQRISGYIGVLFIFMHVTSLRFGWTYGGLMPTFDANYAASSTANHFQHGAAGFFLSLFYLFCVSALVFHLANGLWTAAITWGVTTSAQAQKRWGQVCALAGVALECAAIAAVIGFATLNIPSAQATETRMLHNDLTEKAPPAMTGAATGDPASATEDHSH